MVCIRAVLFLAAFLVAVPIAAQTLLADDCTATRIVAAPVANATRDGDSGSDILRSVEAAPLTRSTPYFPIDAVGSVRGQRDAAQRRQRALTALYASYVALQLLDVHSTQRSLAFGAREANPLMAPIAGNVLTFGVLKVGVTTLTIRALEKLRNRNPAAAMAVMVGLTSLNAVVVTNNYRVQSRR